MRFSWFTPCLGTASVCATRILAQGEITAGTPREFLAFVERERVAYPVTVCFDSPGGNVAGAIGLGRAIRARGFDTCLEDEYSEELPNRPLRTVVEAPVCASACTFAFLGGLKRDLSDRVRFGVHQFSGPRGNIGDGATQVTVVQIAAYIEEMGVDRQLLDLASLVPPDRIRYVEVDLLAELRVTNTREPPPEWKLGATDSGHTFALVRQTHNDKPMVTSLVIVKGQPAATLYISFRLDRPTRTPRVIQERLDEAPLDIVVDGASLGRIERPRWRLSKGEYVTSVTLSPGGVARLVNARAVRISVDMGNAYRDIDPSIDLSTRGLAKNVRAVLR